MDVMLKNTLKDLPKSYSQLGLCLNWFIDHKPTSIKKNYYHRNGNLKTPRPWWQSLFPASAAFYPVLVGVGLFIHYETFFFFVKCEGIGLLGKILRRNRDLGKKNGGKVGCKVGVLERKPSETHEGGETCLAIWIIQLCLFLGKETGMFRNADCVQKGRVLLCWVLLREQVCSPCFLLLLVEKRGRCHSCPVLLLQAIHRARRHVFWVLVPYGKLHGLLVILNSGSHLGWLSLHPGDTIGNVWNQFWLSQLGEDLWVFC